MRALSSHLLSTLRSLDLSVYKLSCESMKALMDSLLATSIEHLNISESNFKLKHGGLPILYIANLIERCKKNQIKKLEIEGAGLSMYNVRNDNDFFIEKLIRSMALNHPNGDACLYDLGISSVDELDRLNSLIEELDAKDNIILDQRWTDSSEEESEEE